jgi:hypothetical protein
LKVEDVLEEFEEKKIKIESAKEKLPEEKYSDQDYKKDRIVLATQTSVEFVKLYCPAVTLGAASIACMLGAHGIMKKRNVALAAAYKVIEGGFKDYRRRVVEELGVDKDIQFKTGIKKDVIEVTEQDGKKKPTKKTVDVLDPNQYSTYARFFDESCSQWSKTPEYNMVFLKCQQNFANDLLHARGHLFLNEVYDMLGIDHSQAGAVVGWIMSKDGDNFVDFGIYDIDNKASRAFVNGYERSILLDFNVDGVIYDK